MSTKSSTKGSLRSTVPTSSISNSVRSRAKTIKCGIKRIKKSANALVRPFKRAKHALSNVSTPVVSDGEDDSVRTEDQATDEVIEVSSDGEGQEKLKEDLGVPSFIHSFYLCNSFQFSAAAQKTWRSPIYSFFETDVTVEVHKGRVAHFFTCAAVKCRSEAGGVRCFQDKGDKSSTANLRHHALRCFGEDAVNTATKGELATSRSGNLFSRFARQGQQPVTYSHCSHSTPEFR